MSIDSCICVSFYITIPVYIALSLVLYIYFTVVFPLSSCNIEPGYALVLNKHNQTQCYREGRNCVVYRTKQCATYTEKGMQKAHKHGRLSTLSLMLRGNNRKLNS